MRAEAERRAAEIMAGCDAEARWQHLFDGFRMHRRLTRELRILVLELEALRQQVCPDMPLAEWAELWEQHALAEDNNSSVR
jgi:hypothetical protein